MSAHSEASRLIEMTSERLCRDIARADGRGHDIAATSRAKLLEAAWGARESNLSAAAIVSLAAGLPAQISIDPSGLEPDCVFPAPVCRIVLNLLLLAADSLPSGGTVMLAGSPQDLFLRIDGPAASWPSGMGACVVDDAAATAALKAGGMVQMPLTTLLAHASGIRLSFVLSPSGQSEPAILRLGGA